MVSHQGQLFYLKDCEVGAKVEAFRARIGTGSESVVTENIKKERGTVTGQAVTEKRGEGAQGGGNWVIGRCVRVCTL